MIALGLSILAVVAGIHTPPRHHRCHWTKSTTTLWGHTSVEWSRKCGNSTYVFTTSQPGPDAAPAARGKAVTMIPLCPPVAAIPRGWWVTESDGTYVTCAGRNR